MKIISESSYQRLVGEHGKLRDLKTEHKLDEKRWEKSVSLLEETIEEQKDEIKVLTQLKNDRITTKTKLVELDAREKLLKSREEAMKNREEAIELEDTKKYKSGYEDGVADGLRRGYELTADDRQNMASIAALAAASHSDGATQKIAEQIVIGMEKTRESKQLSAGNKKKS